MSEMSVSDAALIQAIVLRTAQSALASRLGMARAGGKTYGGNRDVAEVCGYKDNLIPEDYYVRYRRNGLAQRVVKSFPDATWRGVGGELIEDEDPNNVTPFEAAWFELEERLKVWHMFRRGDVLAGLGQYGIIVIGTTKGKSLAEPLDRLSSTADVIFLAPYGERDVTIKTYVDSVTDPRYGQPLIYELKQATPGVTQIEGESKTNKTASIDVHYSRVQHIADGFENDILSIPRLEPVWNVLDDLDKIIGGGSEASWQRANPGRQFKLDKDVIFEPGEEDKLSDSITEWLHGLRKDFRSRGVDVEQFMADVSNFDKNAAAVLQLIAAGSQIPQRILLGSERGQLASEQDRDNWNERVQDRRTEWAAPMVVRPFVDRLIALGALPTPVSYEVAWPQIHDLTDQERAEYAHKLALINKDNGGPVILGNEIRDWAFGAEPLTPEEVDAERPPAPPAAAPGPNALPVAARVRQVVRMLKAKKVKSRKHMTWLLAGRRPVSKEKVA